MLDFGGSCASSLRLPHHTARPTLLASASAGYALRGRAASMRAGTESALKPEHARRPSAASCIQNSILRDALIIVIIVARGGEPASHNA